MFLCFGFVFLCLEFFCVLKFVCVCVLFLCVYVFLCFAFCILCVCLCFVFCEICVLCFLCFVKFGSFVKFVFCVFAFFGVFGVFLGVPDFAPPKSESEVKLFFDFPEQECFWGSDITESYLKRGKRGFLEGPGGGFWGAPGA